MNTSGVGCNPFSGTIYAQDITSECELKYDWLAQEKNTEKNLDASHCVTIIWSIAYAYSISSRTQDWVSRQENSR